MSLPASEPPAKRCGAGAPVAESGSALPAGAAHGAGQAHGPMTTPMQAGAQEPAHTQAQAQVQALAPPAAGPAPSLPRLLAYGALAMPLAFAALPLYVQWPAHAASAWGMSLATLGALLLAVRVGDAFIDPWIGGRIDRLFARSARLAWLGAGAAAACIAGGLTALMFAPATVRADGGALLAWAAAALVLTSLGYSVASVTHQAWAVRLGGGAGVQARWVGAREALALAGVIVASVLPAMAGWGVTLGVLGALLALGWLMLGLVPPPGHVRLGHRVIHTAGDAPGRRADADQRSAMLSGPRGDASSPLRSAADDASPWRDPGFRQLMPVVLLGGLASAIPASLVVLYVRDLLQAPGAAEGWVLGLYFAAAAAAMPLWVRAVGRYGLLPAWLSGMVIAIGAFAGAALLGPGDVALFALICAASGLALGADLVVPPALLAGLIQRHAAMRQGEDCQRASHGRSPRAGSEATTPEAPAPRAALAAREASEPAGAAGFEGRWFGWWNFASKLTLAAAAGIALPLVQWLGYSPGARDDASLAALAICYAALPCAIKAAAAALLWRRRHAWAWAMGAERPNTQ